MVGKNRKFALLVALAAALVMLFVVSSVALADSSTPDTICVDGYVINHRELAVDGTKTLPAALYVEAIGPGGTYSETVGADGYFKFDALPAGTWNFRLRLPDGWEGIVPAASVGGRADTGSTVLTGQTACYRIVFKIRRVFDVVVVKWEELLDGTVQPGVGWDITATPIGDPFAVVQTATTDATGRAVVTLSAGRWVIRETLKTGWKPITPSQVTVDIDQYAAPGAMYPVVFKNLQPPCWSEIDVLKFGWGLDAKGNKTLLGPLSGWMVTVRRADGTMAPITKATDAFGKAAFANLPPGVYTVQEQSKVGWQVASDNPQTVIHRDCEVTQVKFDNIELKGTLNISGRKLFAAWTWPYRGTTIGLSGWVITATLVGASNSATTVTDALGNYVFPEAQLAAAGIAFPGASVKVCEEDRDHWIHLTPNCVTIKFPYPVPAGYTGATVNFKNMQDPPVVGAAAGPSGACRATVVVSKGTNLAWIAAQYGTSVGALAQANNIKNVNLVYAGAQVCVP